ncbi:hypothetical protein L249_0187 [Ophiocordyceps polyrhachis-furcata BCC 54312]|uniref:Uncharacterized protein n=1 Tax=Ophiocordyceps polyrhachis-furcata BCC 54312 TaxID=1330021 RepID=A0A367LDC6_9HYPO|nr:hypothetical protein L249_0187 [Ophiocordyceps polyrhachis-furcata BCC 54312]
MRGKVSNKARPVQDPTLPLPVLPPIVRSNLKISSFYPPPPPPVFFFLNRALRGNHDEVRRHDAVSVFTGHLLSNPIYQPTPPQSTNNWGCRYPPNPHHVFRNLHINLKPSSTAKIHSPAPVIGSSPLCHRYTYRPAPPPPPSALLVNIIQLVKKEKLTHAINRSREILSIRSPHTPLLFSSPFSLSSSSIMSSPLPPHPPPPARSTDLHKPQKPGEQAMTAAPCRVDSRTPHPLLNHTVWYQKRNH